MAGKCVFTFDDTNDNTYSAALPILKANGLVGTAYVITGVIGNTGRMTATQIQELQVEGWEVGSHSTDSTLLTTLNEADARARMADSRAALEALGLHVLSFGAPSRAWSSDLATWAADYYTVARAGIAGTIEPLPVAAPLYIDNVAPSYDSESDTVTDAKGWIDQAIAGDDLVVLLFHHVRDLPGDNYSASISDFTEIAEYAALKVAEGALVVETMSQAAGFVFPPDPVPSSVKVSIGAGSSVSLALSGSSPLRAFAGGEVKGISLVAPGSPNDSGIRVQTENGMLAVEKA